MMNDEIASNISQVTGLFRTAFVGMESSLLAITIVFSIIGFFILVIVICSTICLFQAKVSTDPEKDEKSSETGDGCWAEQKYEFRFHMGCFPRCKGPHKTLIKKSERKIRPCWFRVCCCCCQDLSEKSNGRFLDEVTVLPRTISTSDLDQRPKKLDPNMVGGMARPSLFGIEPIHIQKDRYNEAELQTAENANVDSVDFYAYQVDANMDDKVVY